MKRFNRILVPVDFGPASTAAVACANDLARAFGATVFLLHAVDDPGATGVWTPEVYVPASEAMRHSLTQQAERQLQAMIVSGPIAELAPQVDVRVGAPIPVIEEYAGEQRIDLIVMGTHGRKGLAHVLLGSVAERLVRTAPCPVLTVRENREFATDRRAEARQQFPVPAIGM